MHCALTIHPDSRCPAVTGIEVDVARVGGATLTLDYLLTGNVGALKFPRPQWLTVRADELWKHTCFEAFVRTEGVDPYYEFNFATSMRSAAYGFDSYRSGMRVLEQMGETRIATQSDKAHCHLTVGLDLGSLPQLSPDAVWRLGLSAVIEDASGGLSYWALAHPPGKPDFHHADSFAVGLPPSAGKQ